MTGAVTPPASSPPPPKRPLRLRAAQRVQRNADFQAARAEGRRIDCGAFLLVVRTRPGPGPARVGVVASRAAVGNAVQRARAKRRLRDLFRRHQHELPAGVDLILTARGSLLRIERTELDQRFLRACRRLGEPAARHE